jgi:hypothetical protein
MAAQLELLKTSPGQAVLQAERKCWAMGGYCQWESDGTMWSATTNSA